MQQIAGMIRAAANYYDLIDKGDKIAVGVSGGKDSLALLSALASLKSYYPKKFDLVALTVDPQFNNALTDFSAIEDFCSDLNISLKIRRSNLGKIVFEDRKEKNPCSLCSRMRRGILHNMALENNCNKIALGHHYDDAVQTFFMNLFNSGRIGCFSPKAYLDRKKLWLIRPMIFCPEKLIAHAAKKYSFPVLKSKCPVDKITSRAETETLVRDLEKLYPDLRAKIIGAMQRSNINGW